MAVVSNWLNDAARELHIEQIDMCDGSLTHGVIMEIIGKHCPFKEGVAYMPVPRCETCKHWSSIEHEHTWGDCLHNEHHEGVHLIVEDIISTHKDFGCVRWEAR